MDPDPLRDLAVRDHELEAGVAGICDLPAGGRAHHEDSRWTERLPKRQPFRHRRHAERGRTGPERRGPDVDRAVPVTVRLDDRPELGALESAEERPDVPPDRTQVDDQVGAGHQPDAKGYWIWVSQLASKVSVPGPPMQTSVPPSPRSMSLPPPPRMQSSPFFPRRLVSAAAVPMTRSSPFPPSPPPVARTVTVIPLHAGFGFF